MGKVFITDEVNDMYTADVTNAGKLKIEDGVASFLLLDSAYSLASAQRVCSTPCYLKNVIIGRFPATAASLHLYDCASAGLEGVTSFGKSGSNIIGRITFDVGAASAMVCGKAEYAPINMPFNVYCASGLVVGISVSAAIADGYKGCMEDVTITYQA